MAKATKSAESDAFDQDVHYVPQFLLRRWCGADKRLGVFTALPHIVTYGRTGPKHTGYEPNLTAFDGVVGAKRHAIETDYMRVIDDAAAVATDKLCANGTLTNGEKEALARFVMSLRIRPPDAIAFAKDDSARVLKAELSKKPADYDGLRGPGDPQNLHEYAMRAAPLRVQNFGLEVTVDAIENRPLRERLCKMSWWTVDISTSGETLLLSDHPCLLLGNALDGPCLIVLPISPTVALFICNQLQTVSLYQAMPLRDLVKKLNRSSVEASTKRVYATDKSHAKLIQKRLVTRRKPIASG